MSEPLLADLTSHRIEGIAIMGNTPFSVPLISYVGSFKQGTLHQGGCKHGLAVDFDVIISLYPWENYVANSAHTVIEVQMFDQLGLIPDATLDHLADEIAWQLERGQRVLVHCQAGLNRSSLLIAHYLMKHEGLTADEAITLVRKRSEACLCNPDFEAWLRGN